MGDQNRRNPTAARHHFLRFVIPFSSNLVFTLRNMHPSDAKSIGCQIIFRAMCFFHFNFPCTMIHLKRLVWDFSGKEQAGNVAVKVGQIIVVLCELNILDP